jgi:outer membrane protein insertion porin family
MRYKFVVVAFLACVLSVLAPLAAPGLAVTSAYAETVSSIVVEGNQRIENDTILAYVQVSPGQNASAEKLDASV